MITKHFFKTVLLFTLMIGLSLLFVLVLNHFDSKADSANILNDTKVAK